MKVVYLAAGAAGMYCGSCLRDNRLAATLIEQGHDIDLIPLYTPLKTDESDVSLRPVYYGGINVYLQQMSSVFRHTPRFIDRLLDSNLLLNRVGKWAGSTQASDLGALTVSVLRGEDGAQRKELDRLIKGLAELRPAVINLPNLMFVGVAREMKKRLGAAIVCTLSGEDIFLDELTEPHRSQAFGLIRERGADVDAFVSVTRYFADHAVQHFGLPPDRMRYIPMGVQCDDFEHANPSADEPFTVGYLARICPEKGLHTLCDAMALLYKQGRSFRLRVAGYLGSGDQQYFEDVRERVRIAGMSDAFDHWGEISRQDKLRFLRSLHVLSVPTHYKEAKGMFCIEALAGGVPLVQPAHGSFPEIIEQTGGGILHEPGNAQSLADAIARLMDDADLRNSLALAGRAAVHERFHSRTMANQTWALYEELGNRHTQ